MHYTMLWFTAFKFRRYWFVVAVFVSFFFFFFNLHSPYINYRQPTTNKIWRKNKFNWFEYTQPADLKPIWDCRVSPDTIKVCRLSLKTKILWCFCCCSSLCCCLYSLYTLCSTARQLNEFVLCRDARFASISKSISRSMKDCLLTCIRWLLLLFLWWLPAIRGDKKESKDMFVCIVRCILVQFFGMVSGHMCVIVVYYMFYLVIMLNAIVAIERNNLNTAGEYLLE